ncbi:MAG: HAD family phosphatase [Patulibacter sp.]|nr:HAD family phosphatase [Patulibacter sp.]
MSAAYGHASSGDPVVWFDFGGVLSAPIEELFLGYERKTGISPAALKQAMADAAQERFGLPALAPIELGLLTEAQWGADLRRHLGLRDPGLDLSRAELETFGEQWFAGEEPQAGVRELMAELKDDGVRVAVLTNNVVEWAPHWRAVAQIDDLAELVVDSSEVGLRKPDPSIFARAAQLAGAPPHEHILIDDLTENGDGARLAGWRAITFTSAEQTREALTALLAEPAAAACPFSAAH